MRARSKRLFMLMVVLALLALQGCSGATGSSATVRPAETVKLPPVTAADFAAPEAVVARWLLAMQSRDVDAIVECFDPGIMREGADLYGLDYARYVEDVKGWWREAYKNDPQRAIYNWSINRTEPYDNDRVAVKVFVRRRIDGQNLEGHYVIHTRILDGRWYVNPNSS